MDEKVLLMAINVRFILFDLNPIHMIHLSMKSNKSGGSGYMYMVSGSTTLASIGSSSRGASFNNSSWNGSYSTDYVDMTVPVTATTVGIDESVVITIGATANSMYCQEFRIIYE